MKCWMFILMLAGLLTACASGSPETEVPTVADVATTEPATAVPSPSPTVTVTPTAMTPTPVSFPWIRFQGDLYDTSTCVFGQEIELVANYSSPISVTMMYTFTALTISEEGHVYPTISASEEPASFGPAQNGVFTTGKMDYGGMLKKNGETVLFMTVTLVIEMTPIDGSFRPMQATKVFTCMQPADVNPTSVTASPVPAISPTPGSSEGVPVDLGTP